LFRGRRDGQVKIRGFRVAPEEIEAVLREHPDVRGAVVASRQDAGERRLVAGVVAGEAGAPNRQALRAFLQAKLPEYMVPIEYHFLAALPLTPNGKVDRAALLKLAPAPSARGREGTAPRDELERRLSRAWEAALGVAPVGIED